MRLAIAPGDIFLYSGTSLVDDIIRVGTLSTFNHVAVVMPGSQSLVQALPEGVGIAPLGNKGPAWHVSTCLAWSHAASAFVKSVVGEPYSYLNDLVAGLGFGPITDSAWECAQLGAKILSILGCDIGKDCDTPQKVAAFLATRGNLFQYITF